MPRTASSFEAREFPCHSLNHKPSHHMKYSAPFRASFTLALAYALTFSAFAQERPERPERPRPSSENRDATKESSPKKEDAKDTKDAKSKDDAKLTANVPDASAKPVVITNTVTIAGQSVTYTVETGMLPLLKRT